MDNQHRLIKGYLELSPAEVALMNELKEQGANLAEALDAIGQIPEVDQRALAIARTELQTGFMWLIRAIARPQGFC